MTPKDITAQLFELVDADYIAFTHKLIPNVEVERIIGVRTPALRGLAKEISKNGAREEFMRDLPHKYHDENLLHSILIGYGCRDANAVLAEVQAFLPYVDNWAVCDVISPNVFKKHAEVLLPMIPVWIKSNQTYTVRYGVNCLMQYFLDDERFSANQLDLAAAIHTDEYYVNMSIAWYFSTALIKQYDATLPLIEAKTLDKFVQNKSIQKATESFRISDERKNYLRSLKI